MPENIEIARAYKGKKPYIFISYSHRDNKIVYPIIHQLSKLGFPIWYDEGIHPGNEWPDEVAKALYDCSGFFVFISNNSVSSRNVLDEINFSINEGKPFLAIYIEQTELPLGLKLRIGNTQALLQHTFDSASFQIKILDVLQKWGIEHQSLLTDNSVSSEAEQNHESLLLQRQLEEIKQQRVEIEQALTVNRVIMDAKIQESHKDYFEAIYILEEGLQKMKHRDYYDLLSYYYEMVHDSDRTISTLQEAVQTNHYDYRMVYKLADLLIGQKRYLEALGYLQISIRMSELNYQAFYSTGKTYEALEDPIHAIPNYYKAIEMKPDFVSAYLRINSCLIKLEQENEAIEILQAGCSNMPHNFKMLDALIDLLTLNNRKQEASKWIDSFNGPEFQKRKLEQYVRRTSS